MKKRLLYLDEQLQTVGMLEDDETQRAIAEALGTL